MKKFAYSALLSFAMILTGCDKDRWAEKNSNPSAITTPNPDFLFTQALYETGKSGMYQQWYYNNSQYILPWTGAMATTSGTFNQMGAVGGGVADFHLKVLTPLNIMRHQVAQMSAEDQLNHEQYVAMTYPLQILTALRYTDQFGPMQYVGAAMVQVAENQEDALVIPYQTQAELFDIWNAELKAAATVLFDNSYAKSIRPAGKQDFVYGGNFENWGKVANTLRLKIAARMLHMDRAKAEGIIQDVWNTYGEAGILGSTADDFTWRPAEHFFRPGNENNPTQTDGAKNIIDFMVENNDPRVRFLYDKNDFNHGVIEMFLKEEFDRTVVERGEAIRKGAPEPAAVSIIPNHIREKYVTSSVDSIAEYTYTEDEVEYTINVPATWVTFRDWNSAQDELAARYVGAPGTPDANTDAEYYNVGNIYKLGGITYDVTSDINQKAMHTARDLYTPGTKDNRYDEDGRYTEYFISSAEAQMYIAEFMTLGIISGDANEHFQRAVELSVLKYDNMADAAKILYYDNGDAIPYPEYDTPVKLGKDEIANLKEQPNYTIAGDSKEVALEKIYAQMFIDFVRQPNDLFVTVRRSGHPKKVSSILQREPLTMGGAEVAIPRRMTVSAPKVGALDEQITLDAYQAAGFTVGTIDPNTLNAERLEYDKGAPAMGEGSNY